ncbi:FAD/NAD(P)-binding domain-containing protein [Xylariaceae sp. FL0662B]|nr:FAD/NAD(P)-binding domain-containing protein [Xylariaceae sp. FL0662B]
MGSYDSSNVRSVANPYKVLIAGGCYAGLAAAINLLERCDTIDAPIPVEVTIVDERDGFYHVIGSPLALAKSGYAEKAWVEFKDVKVLQRPNVRFIHGTLDKVDCENKTATIVEHGSQTAQTENYDFFIAATGLRRVWPVVPQSLHRKDYLTEVSKHVDAVENSKAPILVVGGGAVGIEMAAELKYAQPHVNVTLAHSRDKLLSAEPFPDMVKDCAYDLTVQSGVEVLLNHRLHSSNLVKNDDGTEFYEIEFSNGKKMIAGEIIMAISRSVPSTSFLPKESLTDNGYVNVLPTLQLSSDVPNAKCHFAVGDLIYWSGIKRCGSAMHQGKFAGLNIHQIMLQETQGKEPTFNEIGEVPPMIGLAVGSNALAYGTEGMSHGPQVMKVFFEDDLGFRIVWDHLRLGGIKA